ncbi:MAG: M48 family metalloprotease [Desulfosarcinaceae bacterium]|nr:M48 family metalloprotease [Desulfosarcinaceae bacterium]
MKKSVLKYLAIVLVSTLIGQLPAAPASAITVKEERDLSREFLKVVMARSDIIQDQEVNAYLNEIGQRILRALPDQPFPYKFYVIRDDVYNAFASPAGHIFINSGLFAALESEGELAGIMAHEIAHVVCRHISQRIERAKKINLATLAGMVAGVFLGVGGAASAGSAVTAGSMAAGQTAALAYSRDDEMQADQLGLQYLQKAGYSGEGLLTSLRKIRSKQWFGSEEIPTYLMTHPASEDRMAYIDSWLAQHESQRRDQTASVNHQFQRVRTRLAALYTDKATALAYFRERVAQAPENSLMRYGYALALDRQDQRQAAADQLRSALERDALDAHLLQELGRIYFLDGKYEQARTTLKSALPLTRYNAEGRFYLGRTMLKLGVLEEAAAAFETVLRDKSDYTEAYYFLGETRSKQGRMSDAHYHLGQYYWRTKDLKNAAFHLRRALKEAPDPARREAIESLLESITRKQEQAKKAQEQGSPRKGRRP